jgi:hypothetical protein
MSFFEDDDVQTMSEGHVDKVLGLEDSQSKKLVQSLTEAKKDVLNKLSRAKHGSFTEQQMRGTLVQIDSTLQALNDSMLSRFRDAADTFGGLGVTHLISEINKFSKIFTGAVVPLNLNAAIIAQDTSNFLFNRYESSVSAYTEGLRGQLASGLVESVLAQDSYPEVIGKIGQYFAGEEWKINRIARTELHNMYNKAKLRGMGEVQENTLPALKKSLYHPMDSRTGKDSQFAARKHLVADIDKPFVYQWNGSKREFMTPPDRPNDRSILIPYQADWDS